MSIELSMQNFNSVVLEIFEFGNRGTYLLIVFPVLWALQDLDANKQLTVFLLKSYTQSSCCRLGA